MTSQDAIFHFTAGPSMHFFSTPRHSMTAVSAAPAAAMHAPCVADEVCGPESTSCTDNIPCPASATLAPLQEPSSSEHQGIPMEDDEPGGVPLDPDFTDQNAYSTPSLTYPDPEHGYPDNLQIPRHYVASLNNRTSQSSQEDSIQSAVSGLASLNIPRLGYSSANDPLLHVYAQHEQTSQFLPQPPAPYAPNSFTSTQYLPSGSHNDPSVTPQTTPPVFPTSVRGSSPSVPISHSNSIPTSDGLHVVQSTQAEMFPVGTLHTDQTPHLPEDLADDVRQGYDVQAFLDRWHLDEQNHLPRHYSIALESSRIRDWRPPPDAWSQDLTDSGRDIQGLDWSGLETDRRTARAVRKILSPKYSEFERWPVPKQATFSPTRTIRQGSFYHFSQMLFQHRAIYTHYQLRNVLAATSRNDVFYATQNKVIRTSLACPSVADIVLDLSNSPNEPRSSAADYRITTIAASPPSAFTSYASESVLIAGSFQGEYALLNLNSCHPTKPTEGLLTHAWDGISTHIQVIPHRRTGALSAAFCSNDHKLRLLDVATDTWTATFTYQHSLNCSATSPDGRLRVVLGDWDETLVTDAERGTVLVRSRQHEERQDWRASVWGFSCAWSDDGRHVATGAQDGRVVVYDARNWRTPLTVLGCEMGYARSLQFTASGAIGGGPALVIGESDDVVSVYDARTWDTKQDVDFFGSIAGVAALEGGRELIVANSDKTVGGLMVFSEYDANRAASGWYDDNRAAEGMGDGDDWNGALGRRSKKRVTQLDEEDGYWENQPKRFGFGVGNVHV